MEREVLEGFNEEAKINKYELEHLQRQMDLNYQDNTLFSDDEDDAIDSNNLDKDITQNTLGNNQDFQYNIVPTASVHVEENLHVRLVEENFHVRRNLDFESGKVLPNYYKIIIAIIAVAVFFYSFVVLEEEEFQPIDQRPQVVVEKNFTLPARGRNFTIPVVPVVSPTASPVHQSSSKLFSMNGSEDANATLIFLHGLGDIFTNWHDKFLPIRSKFPFLKIIIPTASFGPVSVFGNKIMARWHNVMNLDTIDEILHEDNSFLGSVASIEEIIKLEIKLGVSPSRIVLCGYSQGAAMSLFIGTRNTFHIGAVISVAGYYPIATSKIFKFKRIVVSKTKFILYHGSNDKVVPLSFFQRALLKLKDFDVVSKVYANADHHIFPFAFDDLSIFLERFYSQNT